MSAVALFGVVVSREFAGLDDWIKSSKTCERREGFHDSVVPADAGLGFRLHAPMVVRGAFDVVELVLADAVQRHGWWWYVETSAYRNSELIIEQLTLRIFRETCQPVVSAAATTRLNADALVRACLCGGHVLFGEFVVVVGREFVLQSGDVCVAVRCPEPGWRGWK